MLPHANLRRVRYLGLLLLASCASTTPWHVERAKDVPAERPLRAGFLIVDGVYNTEVTAPFDLLHHTVFHTKPGVEVFTVAPTKAAVRTFEGLVLTPDHDFASAPEIDILVVASAEHSMDTDLENEAMIRWVREVGGRARFVMSLCDGAFVLAKAGLLDGLWATTFPSDQDRFEAMFPAVDVKRGVSFVHDGQALTSEGGAKSFDVAMYLIEHLYGTKVAEGVGRGLIIAWPPDAMAHAVRPTPR